MEPMEPKYYKSVHGRPHTEPVTDDHDESREDRETLTRGGVLLVAILFLSPFVCAALILLYDRLVPGARW